MPVKNKGGRPTKYTPEFIRAEAEALIRWFGEHADNVYLKHFAIRGYNDCTAPKPYSPQRLSEWAKQRVGDKEDGELLNPEFAEALEIAKAIEECKLVEGGLSGKFNAGVTCFTLKNVTQMRDSQDLTLQGSATNPIVVADFRNGKSLEKDDTEAEVPKRDA